MNNQLTFSDDDKVAGVPIKRLLRNLDETSYNEGSDALCCRLSDCERVIRELLATRTPSAAAGEVPGYKLVPVEPTDAMMDAAEACSNDWPRTTWKRAWEDMLAAAPQPPAAAEAGDDDLLDVVRTFCSIAARLRELPPEKRQHYPQPTAEGSPLLAAARAACVARGYTEDGLSTDAAPAPTSSRAQAAGVPIKTWQERLRDYEWAANHGGRSETAMLSEINDLRAFSSGLMMACEQLRADRAALAATPSEPSAKEEILAEAQQRMWEALDRKACPGPWMQIASDAVLGFKTDSYGHATPSEKPDGLQYRACCDHPDCPTCGGFGGYYRMSATPSEEAAKMAYRLRCMGLTPCDEAAAMLERLATPSEAAPAGQSEGGAGDGVVLETEFAALMVSEFRRAQLFNMADKLSSIIVAQEIERDALAAAQPTKEWGEPNA